MRRNTHALNPFRSPLYRVLTIPGNLHGSRAGAADDQDLDTLNLENTNPVLKEDTDPFLLEKE